MTSKHPCDNLAEPLYFNRATVIIFCLIYLYKYVFNEDFRHSSKPTINAKCRKITIDTLKPLYDEVILNNSFRNSVIYGPRTVYGLPYLYISLYIDIVIYYYFVLNNYYYTRSTHQVTMYHLQILSKNCLKYSAPL